MAQIENDPSARLQLVSVGNLQSPGSCYVCGNASCEGGYVDFGTFVDYHGSFYLCMTCAYECANLIGFFSPEEVASQQDTMVSINARNAELAEEVEQLRERLSAINILWPNGSATADSNNSASSTEPEHESADPKPLKGSASGKSTAKKSVTVTGHSNPLRS